MGHLLSVMLGALRDALTEQDSEMVDFALDTDKQINNFDDYIEQKATALLALRQPMAVDLRLAISSLKISVIMERMGDLVKNSIQRSCRMTVPIPKELLRSTLLMLELVTKMLGQTMAAFADENKKEINDIKRLDEELDSYYHNMVETIEQIMIADAKYVPSLVQLLFLGKNLERVGDYLFKFSRIVHYVVSGQKMRKQKADNVPR
jgi:phosphate transport system protein